MGKVGDTVKSSSVGVEASSSQCCMLLSFFQDRTGQDEGHTDTDDVVSDGDMDTMSQHPLQLYICTAFSTQRYMHFTIQEKPRETL